MKAALLTPGFPVAVLDRDDDDLHATACDYIRSLYETDDEDELPHLTGVRSFTVHVLAETRDTPALSTVRVLVGWVPQTTPSDDDNTPDSATVAALTEALATQEVVAE